MHIIDKPLKESIESMLLKLKPNLQALEADLSKKNSLRNSICKLRKKHPCMRFKTYATDKMIYVWRLPDKEEK